MRLFAATALILLASGCRSEQPWEFQNGTGLPDEAPSRIVAEVFEGGECGFACRPPGERVYCAMVGAGDRGPSPEGLRDGERYCFLGTAYDAAGQTIGVGCEVATVGGDAIAVTLSPSDEARQSACEPGPDAGALDAGLRDAGAFDAGTSDAGLRDAGTADAGTADAGLPQTDAGVPTGPVVLSVEATLGGGFLVQNTRTGRGWSVGSGIRFNLTTDPGSTYAIHPQVASGYVFDRFEGGGCDVFIPCEITVVRDTTVQLRFVPQ